MFHASLDAECKLNLLFMEKNSGEKNVSEVANKSFRFKGKVVVIKYRKNLKVRM